MLKIKGIVENILNVKDLKFSTKNIYFLNFIFVDDEIIKKINNTFRKINKSTDVLTFVNFTKNYNSKTEVYCDIFFAAQTIKKDSKKNFIDFYDHMTHLIIHCFLHVNGYDHKKNSDFIKMKSLEEQILMKLSIKSPYIS